MLLWSILNKIFQVIVKTRRMSSRVNEIKKINKDVQLLGLPENPVVVIVGGTSGIGEYTAYKFAKYLKTPTIYIIGTNKQRGEKVLKNLQQLNNNAGAKFYFKTYDLRLVEEADQLATRLLESETRINVLMMSCARINFKGRVETSEGLDEKLALSYYSRWKIIDRVMPLLLAAAGLEQPARVVNLQTGSSVPHSNVENKLLNEDIEMKKYYSVTKFVRHCTVLNCAAMSRFARIYPSVSFIHADPGAVKTSFGNEMPWYDWLFFKAFRCSISPDKAGEKFFYLAYTNVNLKAGPHIMTPSLKDIVSHREHFKSPEFQNRVWTHTQEVFVRILKPMRPVSQEAAVPPAVPEEPMRTGQPMPGGPMPMDQPMKPENPAQPVQPLQPVVQPGEFQGQPPRPMEGFDHHQVD